MKKRRIVLASLLKPVNDTRMFEKMGVSLARSGEYDVHLIGYPSRVDAREPNVHFYPLSPFKRISFGRLGARLKALQFIIKVNPQLLIVSTHELLGVAILIRIFFGVKIIYDIQENYWRSILFTDAFPGLLRPPVAFFVRLKESIAASFFSQFLLAEKCYAKELSFIKKKYIVLENKCNVPKGFRRNPGDDFSQFIFTGTLAKSTGVFQAINLTKRLHAVESKIRLTIIGHCAQPKVLLEIKEEVFRNSFITLIGGQDLVSHETIMDAIATANFGIIYYPRSPHTENKIPTKVFEYLACKLPILLQNHKPWTELCAPIRAAVEIDFEQPDAGLILKEIQTGRFYLNEPEGMTWESEELKLLNLVRTIF